MVEATEVFRPRWEWRAFDRPYPDAVNRTVLNRAGIDRRIALSASTPTEERRSTVGLRPKRADVILAGACIVETVMTKLGKESAMISDRSPRRGLLVERFGA